MHIGIQSPGLQSFAIQNHAIQRQASEHQHDQSRMSDRGARLVARLDQDNDAKLSIGELQGTRLGKKMSIDRFARLDSNGDGLLEAGELNRKGGHQNQGPGQVEQALVAKFADLLSERPAPIDLGQEIAKAVLARLDADGSDGLNSEELAGTRLAAAIGADFYELDSDKSGALDKAELSAFITGEYLDSVEEGETGDFDDHHHEGDESDENDDYDEYDEGGMDADVALAPASAGPVGVSDPVSVAAPVGDAVGDTVPPAAVETTAPQPAGEPALSGPVQASYAEQVLSSFEAALALLQQGSRQQQLAMETARTLYAEAKGALSAT